MSTVLVIDDDEQVRFLCRIMLEAEGYEVTEAADGIVGMELFAEHPTDAVLCDVYMPEMDGIETITRLTSEYIGVRIVAMSANFQAEPSLSSLVRKLGAIRALDKPFSRLDLVTAVRQAIEDAGSGAWV
jgi:two-component system nitrogen regulation response regulator NtrX